MFRVKRPQGNDSFISFEVIFKDENVMGQTGPYR